MAVSTTQRDSNKKCSCHL